MSGNPSARRSIWRRGVAVLGSAALVAAMVDGVAYATSGSSLLFGKAQMTGEVSAAKVQPAAKVKPVGKKTVRLKVGAPHRTMPDEDLYKVRLPKGHYQVAINGLFQQDHSSTHAYLGCLVFDKRIVPQLSDPDPDYRLFYALDSMYWSDTEGSGWDSNIDASNVITLTKTRTIIYGCTSSSDGPIEQATPLHVHFTKLEGITNRSGSDYALPEPRWAGRLIPDKLRR